MTGAGRNVLGVFASQTMLVLVALVTAFFYARALDELELAVIAWVGILVAIDEVFAGLGTPAFLMREFPQKVESEQLDVGLSIVRSFIKVNTLTAVVFAAILTIFSGPAFHLLFDSVPPWGLRCLIVVAVLCASVGRCLSFVAQSARKFMPLSAVTVAKQIVRSSLSIGLYFVMGVSGLVWGILLSELTAALLLAWAVRQELFVPTPSYPILKMLRRSIGYGAEGLVRYVAMQSDMFLVSVMFGPTTLAYYFMARNLVDKLGLVRNSLGRVLVPYLSAAYSRGSESFGHVISKSLDAFSVLVLPSCLLFAASAYWVLNVLGAEKYLAATLPAVVLSINLAIVSYQMVFAQAVFVCGRQTARLTILTVQSAAMLLGLGGLYLVWPDPSGVPLSRLFGAIPSLIVGVRMLKSYGRFSFDLGLFWAGLAAGAAGSALLVLGQLMYYHILLVPAYVAVGLGVSTWVFVNLADERRVHDLAGGSAKPIERFVRLVFRVLTVSKR